MKDQFSYLRKTSWFVLLGSFILVGLNFPVVGLAQEPKTGKSISEKRFQRIMNRKNTVLLDVRTQEEYNSGHLPGALHADVLKTEKFNRLLAGFDKRKKYLLYCRSGKRSNNAKLLMKKAGFEKKLFDLQGGINNWKGELVTHH